MKAVIMAGGEGTRLRPLTCIYPKPMANLGGLPLMAHILNLLSAHGFSEAAVTLLYMPEKIREHFGDESSGVRLRYFEETTPLGTAGSVKNCEAFLDEDFLVISGDSLCDIDLSEAIRFHREHDADATIVLYSVDNPLEYGVTLVNEAGEVTGFIEKPSWSNAFSDTVNTGIYIFKRECLSLIPPGQPFDFARDLFPMMLRTKKRLYGYVSGGYWNDVGNSSAYLASTIDLLDGKVACRIPYPQVFTGVYSGTELPGDVRVTAPCIIGRDVRLLSGAAVGPYVFVGDGASFGPHSTVKRSVILPDAQIGTGCQIRGAIVCERAVLKERVSLYEGSVVGSQTFIGAGSEIMPHVKLWPQKQVRENTCVRENIVWGAGYTGLFDEDGVTGDFGLELTPEYAARLGAAVAYVKKGAILVAYEGGGAAALLAESLCSGIRSAGRECCLSSELPVTLLRFAAQRFGFEAGLHIQSDNGKGVIRLFGGDGFPLCREDERKIEATFQREDYRRATAENILPLRRLDGVGLLYRREVGDACGRIAASVAFAKSDFLSSLLCEAARLAGCDIKDRPGDGALCFDADPVSGSLAVWDEDGGYHPPEQVQALIAKTLADEGSPVYLPFEAPLIIENSAPAQRRAVRVLPDDNIGREGYRLCPALFDPGFGMAQLLRACQNREPLARQFGTLPAFGVVTTELEANANKGAVMRQLSGEGQNREYKKGVRLKMKTGNVLIVPMRQKQGFFIRAEAQDMEAAEELCADISRRIHLYEKEKER